MVRGLLFWASRVRRKLRLRTRRWPWQTAVRRRRLCRRHPSLIRVWWSGWLAAACSAQPSEGPSATLLSREFGLVVEMMGLEPTIPCLQSQIERCCYLRGWGMAQVGAASWLPVIVRWAPVRTAMNGTVVARPARTNLPQT
jgi:hypothetical protein